MARPSRDDMQRALRDALGDGGENLNWEELVQHPRALRAHNESQIALSQEVAISHAQHAQHARRSSSWPAATLLAEIGPQTICWNGVLFFFARQTKPTHVFVF